MPSSTSATVQLGTYNPLTDAFTSVLDLNDGSSIFQLTNSPEIGMPELQIQRTSNARTDGERITNMRYGNRQINMRMSFGKALRYDQIRALLTAFVNLTSLDNAAKNGSIVLRYAPPSPAATVNYSYFDVIAVTHDADKLPAMRILNGTAKVNAILECTPFIRGDRQWLQNLVMNPGFEGPMGGGIGQDYPYMLYDTFANTNAYSGAGTSVASNVMSVTNGSFITFGSPAWRAIANWQIRFKWVTSLAPNFYIHHIDSNNQLYCAVTGTSFSIVYAHGGTFTTLATGVIALTNNNFYWLKATQYPAPSGVAPYVAATLYSDSAGAIGSAVAGSALGPVATSDATSALVGHMAIFVSGATLAVGGNFSNVHLVQLFGPGGWPNHATFGTGIAAYSWDGTRPELGMSGSATAGTQTYNAGPVTSFGALRIDLAPAGTHNDIFESWFGGVTPAGTTAVPLRTVGDVIGLSCAVKSSSLHASNGAVGLGVGEYNSAGTFLRSSTVQTKTGAQVNGAWTTLSGTLTPGASCAYLLIQLIVADASSTSASATVWFDNVQAWNITETGVAAGAMPYCELRSPNSPCQLLVSGLIGELQAPAAYYFGVNTDQPGNGEILSFWIGLRARAGTAAKLTGANVTYGAFTPALDTTAYGGFYTGYPVGTQYDVQPWPTSTLAGGDMTGVYRFLSRLKTSQIAGNLAATSAYPRVAQGLGAYSGSGLANGKLVTPAFAAAATWGALDAGLISTPIAPLGAGQDQSTSLITPDIIVNDPNGAGKTFNLNWSALIPADEEGTLVTGQITVPTSFGQWCNWQVFVDGLNAQFGRSDIDVTALLRNANGNYSMQLTPADGTAGPGIAGTFAAGGTAGVNLGQDSIPQVNPLTTVGSTAGINQGCAVITDASGRVYSFYMDILYTPLYLYPRS